MSYSKSNNYILLHFRKCLKKNIVQWFINILFDKIQLVVLLFHVDVRSDRYFSLRHYPYNADGNSLSIHSFKPSVDRNVSNYLVTIRLIVMPFFYQF